MDQAIEILAKEGQAKLIGNKQIHFIHKKLNENYIKHSADPRRI